MYFVSLMDRTWLEVDANSSLSRHGDDRAYSRCRRRRGSSPMVMYDASRYKAYQNLINPGDKNHRLQIER